VVLAAGPGWAADPSNTTSKGNSPETVVVTTKKQATEIAIDRRVYRLGADIQATTGSAGDVLRNLPSVDVDPLGNISLRGDSGVQVLIDGKPSTLMSSANRADSLLQMPADSIESVEVITTPSAQYKPDGSAGIINIITKKNSTAGLTGVANAAVGSEGRSYLSLSGSYKPSSYRFYGSLNLRLDNRKRTTTYDRQTVASSSTGWIGEAQAVAQQTKRLFASTALGFDHTSPSGDTFGAGMNFYYRAAHPRADELDTTTDVTGVISSDYNRYGKGYEREVSGSANAKYVHNFGEDGHELSLDGQFERTVDYHRMDYTNTYRIPLSAPIYDRMGVTEDEQLYQFSLDYARPLAERSQLQLGYNLETNNDAYLNLGGTLDPISKALTPIAALTNDFYFGRTTHAFYGEYQAGWGRLNLKAGARLEETYVDTNQATTNQRGSTQYGRFYPSLHVEYSLADSHTLRFGYSHRVSRPDPDDMNPYPIWIDAFNYRAGNPHLMPQETHSLEGAYQYEGGGQTATATLFYRVSKNGMTDVVSYLGNNIYLTTKENLTRSTSGGAELSGTGKLIDSLRYNLTGSVYYNEIDASGLGFSGRKSALAYTAKVSFDYQITGSDRAQITANYNGKRLTPQGYRLPTYTINLGLRHQLLDNLAAVLTASDLMNSSREAYRLNTSTLIGTTKKRQLGRIIYLGLSYRFGGKSADKEDRFDFTSDNGG
jgi:outer membrane receptor protein involved in Fe transport